MKRSVLISFIVLTMLLMALPLSNGIAADPLNTSVTGTVAYNPFGTPLFFPNATVIAVNLSDSNEAYQTFSAADGSYTLQLPNGSYLVTAYAEGYNASNPHPNLTVNGESGINLDNLSGRGPLSLQKVYGYINGTVKSNGTPLANASVCAMHGSLSLGDDLTDSSGFFSLYVQSGNHILQVNAENYSQYSAPVNAPESQIVIVSVDMTPLSSYSLRGTVVIVQGPLANAHVNLTRSSLFPGTETTFIQSTDANGVFLFPSALEGDYTIHVTRDGYSEFLNIYENLTITGDTVLQHPIVMREAFGSISGTVCNGTFMISDARMTLIDSEGEIHTLERTDSDGFYEFSDIPTGTYTLKVTRNGYEDMERSVQVYASQTSTADFDLPNIERNYLWGLDMPHSMMMIGIFLGGCLLLIAIAFRLQVGEKPEMLYLRYMEDEDEDEF